ncbi:MAG: bifunctional [glutamate--ammonia ligase]-adenylyl-L-tyrosine phosphorylase/[glutamate--ammonia-ligase] adenylyltransferase [Thermodesulfobacteriota bacterium]
MKIEEIIETGDLEALRKMGFKEAKRALDDLKLLAKSPFMADRAGTERLVSAALGSPSPEMALNNLERVTGHVPEKTIKAVLSNPKGLARLVTLAGSSELLVGYILKSPEILTELFTGKKALINSEKDRAIFLKELRGLIAISGDGVTKETLQKTLRLYKQREYVRIGLRDLLGIATLEEVTAELSDLASASLEIALESSFGALKKRFGAPLYKDARGNIKEAGFTVIGMGKLGGRELNFSSDIDLIYLYTTEAEETEGIEEKARTKISLHEFFVKLAEQVTELINEITEDGNVFRVDLELRPEGRSGEIVNSLSSIETYYESWGRTWERSAMIKARPVAGDMELGAEFLQMIEPFVYRKYLDFRGIEELKGMKEKLDIELMRRAPNSIDVKLGAGGIREIEFFCQALQLIHGGRITTVREKGTLPTIDALLNNTLISPKLAKELKDGYRYLRRLEHKLQIIDGRQTHVLPETSKEADRIARMMGPETETAFIAQYRNVTNEVYAIYRSLFYKSGEALIKGADKEVLLLFSPEISDSEAADSLLKIGFKDTGALLALKTLKDGPPGIRLPERARAILEKIAPFLLTKTLETPDPDAALKHLEGFISAMGAHTTFYALLNENAKVAELLITIFGTSEFLTRTLIEQPGAIDHLLSNDLKTPRKTKPEYARELKEFLEGTGGGKEESGSFEELIDGLRQIKSREILRIGINDILEELDIDEVFLQITTLAEAVLDYAIDLAAKDLAGRYGYPVKNGPNKDRGPKFAVIGLGKLGSGELVYGSDLDIVFVYSEPEQEPTDTNAALTTGPKQISIHEYFVKLAQRIISILTLRTREGLVFEVDMRLRPSGSAGPLVVTGVSLLNYQREKAEVWEAQAMLRARAIAGDMEFGEKITGSLHDIIYSRGLTAKELQEIRRIRGRMENEIAKEGQGRYNIKTGFGALVDIEFICQTLQLKFGLKKPGIRTPKIMGALDALSAEGLLEAKDHLELKRAYSFFTAMTVKLRVVHDRAQGDIFKGSKELTALARRLGYTLDRDGDGGGLANALLNDYITHSQKVRAIYERVLDAL